MSSSCYIIKLNIDTKIEVFQMIERYKSKRGIIMDSQKFGGMRNHKICSIKTSMFFVMKGGDLD